MGTFVILQDILWRYSRVFCNTPGYSQVPSLACKKKATKLLHCKIDFDRKVARRCDYAPEEVWLCT